MKLIDRLVTIALFVLVPCCSVNAYTFKPCGSIPGIKRPDLATLSFNTISFPTGYWLDAMNFAVGLFNANPSKAQITGVSRNATTFSLGDGYNDVAFTDFDNADTDVAVTSTLSTCSAGNNPYQPIWSGSIRESDVKFNSDYAWTAERSVFTKHHGKGSYVTTNPLESADPIVGYQIQLVFLHEALHVFGMGHDNRVLALMNARYPNGGMAGVVPYFLADDIAGIFALYGKRVDQNNVSVLTRYLPYPASCAECGYEDDSINNGTASAVPGESISVDFSFQNTGSTELPAGITMYAYLCPTPTSLPGNCTRMDAFVWNWTPMPVGSSILYRNIQVLIKPEYGQGTKWLGLWVDPSDSRYGNPPQGIVINEPILYDLDNWAIFKRVTIN